VQAIHELRINFSAPIIGIEPAIKPATQNTKSRIIGILATQATLEGDKLSILKQKFGQDITILHQSCLGLVEEIELGNQQSQDLENLIEIYVRPLIEQGADTLVLGCSHYPLVRALIQKLRWRRRYHSRSFFICRLRITKTVGHKKNIKRKQLRDHHLLSNR
jgi:glutamate racemase